MRTMLLAAMLAGGMSWSAAASPFVGASSRPSTAGGVAKPAQFSRGESRDFRRCMRAKYGPNYYRGVKRTHRLFMAQACGG